MGSDVSEAIHGAPDRFSVRWLIWSDTEALAWAAFRSKSSYQALAEWKLNQGDVTGTSKCWKTSAFPADGVCRGRLTHGECLQYAQGATPLHIMNRSVTDGTSKDVGPIEHLGESELLHLADLVPQMIWMCTPQGENIYFNQRWVDFTGMSLEESYGEGWNKPFHPDDQERAWRAWNHAVQTGDRYQVESRIRAASGTYRWFLMRGEPFKEADGRTIKWFGTCTDIHDLKLAETALLRSEKLISAGRMAASVAHEINNPLAAVTNLLFLAKSSEELSTIRSYIDGAEAELNRVTHIARQSLGFYRESTSPALSYVHRLLESAIELLKAKVIAKQAAIETRWRDDVQVSVVAGEVMQVFANLLANSLEAIPSEGIVKIRTSLVFDQKSESPCLRVTIADNGRGIPHVLLPQLFEPFFTTKDTTGIGLGLWVSKQILDKHSGTIRVRSRAEGQRTGTVVRVTFPIQSSSVQD